MCEHDTSCYTEQHRHLIDTTYKCPDGYSNNPGHDNCRKQTETTETFTVNVPYGEKSSDQNHCHKPTPESLNIPSWARGDYGKLANELDTISSNCHQEQTDRRTIDCNNAEIIKCEPVCEWSTWSDCNVACGGGHQYRYLRGEGCSNEEESKVCNEQTCEEPTPTETPGDGGDGGCDPCAEPTPTPTETIEPTPTNTPSGGQGGNGGASAPVCNDITPTDPRILLVTAAGADSVKITWTKVDRANSYSILYGPNSGNYPYSVFSTGNTDNFVINGISGGCFTIKAVNGCMPGPLSPEYCTGTGTGGEVLGASTLGGTGSFTDSINYLLITSGLLLTGLGINKRYQKRIS